MIQRQGITVSLGDPLGCDKRLEISNYFSQSFDLFESLFEVLESDEVFYKQSEPTRHAMIFYFGHTAIFYINKLVVSGVLSQGINPHFETLFAVGVDEMTWDARNDELRWPTVSEVREYRSLVREKVMSVIATLPMALPITQEDPFWAILMGIEHERIHIETSSVLHRQMPLEHIKTHPNFPLCPIAGDALENVLVPMSGANLFLGKGSDDRDLYGWDNEYGSSMYAVEDFEVSKYLVSNGEYMDFVMANGYGISRWWDEEGLKYLEIRGATCPPFWVLQEDGRYKLRTLTQEIEMPYNWPVEVNALEAEAFCRWKSAQDGVTYRLPSEEQWNVMASDVGTIFDDSCANINFALCASSVPVDMFTHGELCDVVGNVWQWTQTQMAPFEGFKAHPWYEDFTTPTFDGKHNIIKGGSWASTGNEIVKYSRYAFRRHFIQHAGFRYVVGASCDEQQKYEKIDSMYQEWKKIYD
jgi:5-histidylcysteine sulfoxide synthase